MFRHSRKPAPELEAARALYAALMQRARAPVFYTDFAVPDTIDGRFDLVALHAFLVFEALKPLGRRGEKVGTHLATEIFSGFEQALRDLGVSDFGMSRRIKALANGFYGRLLAYGEAGSEPALATALVRNLYRGDAARSAEAALLAAYVGDVRKHLAREPEGTTLLKGGADFGPLPTFSPSVHEQP